MAVKQDQAGQSPVYVEQGGKILHWDTGFRLEVNGVPVGLAALFTYAKGAANVCVVTIQVQDLAGNNCLSVFDQTIWLSDSPFGAGFAAHVPTGGVTTTAGFSVFAKVTNIAIEVLTNTFGTVQISITDTSKTGYYVCTEVPGTGLVAVSRQLVAADYG